MINNNFNDYYKIAYKFKEKDNQEDVKILENELNLEKNDKVLDLGCGYGRLSKPLTNKGYDIYGIDYKQEFIMEVKEKTGKKENYEKGNFYKLTDYFDTNSFDKIYSMFTSFGHDSREKDKKMFEGASKILKKGGRLLIEHENYWFHHQNQNIDKKTYYDIDDKYRRIIKSKLKLNDLQLQIYAEIWDLQNQEMLDERKFNINLYTYRDMKNLASEYNLEFIKTRGRYSDNKVYINEPRVFFVFKKK